MQRVFILDERLEHSFSSRAVAVVPRHYIRLQVSAARRPARSDSAARRPPTTEETAARLVGASEALAEAGEALEEGRLVSLE